jgi:glycosyltransferase involved in cell wall biosynthesis
MNELVPYKDLTANPNNAEDIAEKMIKVLEDDNLRQKMIKE